jgi:hypothetical protein
VVRQEIEIAKARNCRLIPILLQWTQMPRPHELPDSLRWITDRVAMRLKKGEKDELDRDLAKIVAKVENPNPGRRFVKAGELEKLGATPVASLRNAVSKPCTMAFAALIALLGIWLDEALLYPLAALTFLLLATITVFTLAEAEWVGAQTERMRELRAEGLDEP